MPTPFLGLTPAKGGSEAVGPARPEEGPLPGRRSRGEKAHLPRTAGCGRSCRRRRPPRSPLREPVRGCGSPELRTRESTHLWRRKSGGSLLNQTNYFAVTAQKSRNEGGRSGQDGKAGGNRNGLRLVKTEQQLNWRDAVELPKHAPGPRRLRGRGRVLLRNTGNRGGRGPGGRAAPHDKHPVRRRGACLHHPPSPPDPAWGWRQGGLWADRASFSPKDGPWVSPPDTLPPRPLGPGCSLIGPARLPHQVPLGPPWRRVSCDGIP